MRGLVIITKCDTSFYDELCSLCVNHYLNKNKNNGFAKCKNRYFNDKTNEKNVNKKSHTVYWKKGQINEMCFWFTPGHVNYWTIEQSEDSLVRRTGKKTCLNILIIIHQITS